MPMDKLVEVTKGSTDEAPVTFGQEPYLSAE
jgi:hypothetical protein